MHASSASTTLPNSGKKNYSRSEWSSLTIQQRILAMNQTLDDVGNTQQHSYEGSDIGQETEIIAINNTLPSHWSVNSMSTGPHHLQERIPPPQQRFNPTSPLLPPSSNSPVSSAVAELPMPTPPSPTKRASVIDIWRKRDSGGGGDIHDDERPPPGAKCRTQTPLVPVSTPPRKAPPPQPAVLNKFDETRNRAEVDDNDGMPPWKKQLLVKKASSRARLSGPKEELTVDNTPAWQKKLSKAPTTPEVSADPADFTVVSSTEKKQQNVGRSATPSSAERPKNIRDFWAQRGLQPITPAEDSQNAPSATPTMVDEDSPASRVSVLDRWKRRTSTPQQQQQQQSSETNNEHESNPQSISLTSNHNSKKSLSQVLIQKPERARSPYSFEEKSEKDPANREVFESETNTQKMSDYWQKRQPKSPPASPSWQKRPESDRTPRNENSLNEPDSGTIPIAAPWQKRHQKVGEPTTFPIPAPWQKCHQKDEGTTEASAPAKPSWQEQLRAASATQKRQFEQQSEIPVWRQNSKQDISKGDEEGGQHMQPEEPSSVLPWRQKSQRAVWGGGAESKHGKEVGRMVENGTSVVSVDVPAFRKLRQPATDPSNTSHEQEQEPEQQISSVPAWQQRSEKNLKTESSGPEALSTPDDRSALWQPKRLNGPDSSEQKQQKPSPAVHSRKPSENKSETERRPETHHGFVTQWQQTRLKPSWESEPKQDNESDRRPEPQQSFSSPWQQNRLKPSRESEPKQDNECDHRPEPQQSFSTPWQQARLHPSWESSGPKQDYGSESRAEPQQRFSTPWQQTRLKPVASLSQQKQQPAPNIPLWAEEPNRATREGEHIDKGKETTFSVSKQQETDRDYVDSESQTHAPPSWKDKEPQISGHSLGFQQSKPRPAQNPQSSNPEVKDVYSPPWKKLQQIEQTSRSWHSHRRSSSADLELKNQTVADRTSPKSAISGGELILPAISDFPSIKQQTVQQTKTSTFIENEQETELGISRRGTVASESARFLPSSVQSTTVRSSSTSMPSPSVAARLAQFQKHESKPSLPFCVKKKVDERNSYVQKILPTSPSVPTRDRQILPAKTYESKDFDDAASSVRGSSVGVPRDKELLTTFSCVTDNGDESTSIGESQAAKSLSNVLGQSLADRIDELSKVSSFKDDDSVSLSHKITRIRSPSPSVAARMAQFGEAVKRSPLTSSLANQLSDAKNSDIASQSESDPGVPSHNRSSGNDGSKPLSDHDDAEYGSDSALSSPQIQGGLGDDGLADAPSLKRVTGPWTLEKEFGDENAGCVAILPFSLPSGESGRVVYAAAQPSYSSALVSGRNENHVTGHKSETWRQQEKSEAKITDRWLAERKENSTITEEASQRGHKPKGKITGRWTIVASGATVFAEAKEQDAAQDEPGASFRVHQHENEVDACPSPRNKGGLDAKGTDRCISNKLAGCEKEISDPAENGKDSQGREEGEEGQEIVLLESSNQTHQHSAGGRECDQWATKENMGSTHGTPAPAPDSEGSLSEQQRSRRVSDSVSEEGLRSVALETKVSGENQRLGRKFVPRALLGRNKDPAWGSPQIVQKFADAEGRKFGPLPLPGVTKIDDRAKASSEMVEESGDHTADLLDTDPSDEESAPIRKRNSGCERPSSETWGSPQIVQKSGDAVGWNFAPRSLPGVTKTDDCAKAAPETVEESGDQSADLLDTDPSVEESAPIHKRNSGCESPTSKTSGSPQIVQKSGDAEGWKFAGVTKTDDCAKASPETVEESGDQSADPLDTDPSDEESAPIRKRYSGCERQPSKTVASSTVSKTAGSEESAASTGTATTTKGTFVAPSAMRKVVSASSRVESSSAPSSPSYVPKPSKLVKLDARESRPKRFSFYKPAVSTERQLGLPDKNMKKHKEGAEKTAETNQSSAERTAETNQSSVRYESSLCPPSPTSPETPVVARYSALSSPPQHMYQSESMLKGGSLLRSLTPLKRRSPTKPALSPRRPASAPASPRRHSARATPVSLIFPSLSKFREANKNMSPTRRDVGGHKSSLRNLKSTRASPFASSFTLARGQANSKRADPSSSPARVSSHYPILPSPNKKWSTLFDRRVLVLSSSQSLAGGQAYLQQQAITILETNHVPYREIDGSLKSNRDRRNELFNISGVWAKYPQFFVEDGKRTLYWGDINRLQECSENGTILESLVFFSSRQPQELSAPRKQHRLGSPPSSLKTSAIDKPPPSPKRSAIETTPPRNKEILRSPDSNPKRLEIERLPTPPKTSAAGTTLPRNQAKPGTPSILEATTQLEADKTASPRKSEQISLQTTPTRNILRLARSLPQTTPPRVHQSRSAGTTLPRNQDIPGSPSRLEAAPQLEADKTASPLRTEQIPLQTTPTRNILRLARSLPLTTPPHVQESRSADTAHPGKEAASGIASICSQRSSSSIPSVHESPTLIVRNIHSYHSRGPDSTATAPAVKPKSPLRQRFELVNNPPESPSSSGQSSASSGSNSCPKKRTAQETPCTASRAKSIGRRHVGRHVEEETAATSITTRRAIGVKTKPNQSAVQLNKSQRKDEVSVVKSCLVCNIYAHRVLAERKGLGPSSDNSTQKKECSTTLEQVQASTEKEKTQTLKESKESNEPNVFNKNVSAKNPSPSVNQSATSNAKLAGKRLMAKKRELQALRRTRASQSYDSTDSRSSNHLYPTKRIQSARQKKLEHHGRKVPSAGDHDLSSKPSEMTEIGILSEQISGAPTPPSPIRSPVVSIEITAVDSAISDEPISAFMPSFEDEVENNPTLGSEFTENDQLCPAGQSMSHGDIHASRNENRDNPPPGCSGRVYQEGEHQGPEKSSEEFCQRRREPASPEESYETQSHQQDEPLSALSVASRATSNIHASENEGRANPPPGYQEGERQGPEKSSEEFSQRTREPAPPEEYYETESHQQDEPMSALSVASKATCITSDGGRSFVWGEEKGSSMSGVQKTASLLSVAGITLSLVSGGDGTAQILTAGCSVLSPMSGTVPPSNDQYMLVSRSLRLDGDTCTARSPGGGRTTLAVDRSTVFQFGDDCSLTSNGGQTLSPDNTSTLLSPISNDGGTISYMLSDAVGSPRAANGRFSFSNVDTNRYETQSAVSGVSKASSFAERAEKRLKQKRRKASDPPTPDSVLNQVPTTDSGIAESEPSEDSNTDGLNHGEFGISVVSEYTKESSAKIDSLKQQDLDELSAIMSHHTPRSSTMISSRLSSRYETTARFAGSVGTEGDTHGGNNTVESPQSMFSGGTGYTGDDSTTYFLGDSVTKDDPSLDRPDAPANSPIGKKARDAVDPSSSFEGADSSSIAGASQGGGTSFSASRIQNASSESTQTRTEYSSNIQQQVHAAGSGSIVTPRFDAVSEGDEEDTTESAVEEEDTTILSNGSNSNNHQSAAFNLGRVVAGFAGDVTSALTFKGFQSVKKTGSSEEQGRFSCHNLLQWEEQEEVAIEVELDPSDDDASEEEGVFTCGKLYGTSSPTEQSVDEHPRRKNRRKQMSV